MRAIVVRETGSADVLRLETVLEPEPGPGQVLVEVRAAAVNPIDWKYRRGLAPATFPLVPGIDFSGIVIATRTAEFIVGDEVCGVASNGSYAQLTTANARHVTHKPIGLTHEIAASVPVSGMTAWQALSAGGKIETGSTVLINGAAGGVGHFTVQLAAVAGAHVIGVGSARNRDFILEMGADEYVDYTLHAVADVARDTDIIIDTVGRETTRTILPALRRGGHFVSVMYPEPADWADTKELVRNGGGRPELVVMRPDSSQLRRLLALAASGALHVEIATVLPLSQVAQAQELSESGHTRGKIVLLPQAA